MKKFKVTTQNGKSIVVSADHELGAINTATVLLFGGSDLTMPACEWRAQFEVEEI